MKKYGILGALLLGVVVMIGYFYSSNKSGKKTSQSDEQGKVYFKYTELPEGVIGRSGTFDILVAEVAKSPSMDAFLSKKNDIQFVLIYQQFVSRSKKTVKNLYLKTPKVSRSLSSLLNQYGVPLKGGTKVHFSSEKTGGAVALADDQPIFLKDIDYNNFIWATLATEIFHFKLGSVDKLLKRKVMEAEARKLKISKEKYKDDHVYKRLIKKISDSDIKKYMERYSMENSDFNQRSARDMLLRDRKQRALDYILEKYLIKFPVEVDIKRPNFSLETKSDWTPVLGTGKKIEVTFWGDTRSETSQKLLKDLIPLVSENSDLKFHYRPVFLEGNKLQKTITQAHLCVWKNYPEKFWRYFEMTLGSLNEETEKKLYSQLEKLNLKVQPIRDCLVQQKMKEVVEYHIDYANFLGIHLGPILYVGGEVLHGRILIEDVKEILARQLEIPTAAVWKKDFL